MILIAACILAASLILFVVALALCIVAARADERDDQMQRAFGEIVEFPGKSRPGAGVERGSAGAVSHRSIHGDQLGSSSGRKHP